MKISLILISIIFIFDFGCVRPTEPSTRYKGQIINLANINNPGLIKITVKETVNDYYNYFVPYEYIDYLGLYDFVDFSVQYTNTLALAQNIIKDTISICVDTLDGVNTKYMIRELNGSFKNTNNNNHVQGHIYDIEDELLMNYSINTRKTNNKPLTISYKCIEFKLVRFNSDTVWLPKNFVVDTSKYYATYQIDRLSRKIKINGRNLIWNLSKNH